MGQVLRLAAIEQDAVNMTVGEALQAQRIYEEAGTSRKPARSGTDSGEVHGSDGLLVFGLFGATLGAQPSYRSSRSFAFVLTLGIIAVYYVIGFSFSSLGVGQSAADPGGMAAGGAVFGAGGLC